MTGTEDRFDGRKAHVSAAEGIGLAIAQGNEHAAIATHPDLPGSICIGGFPERMNVRVNCIADQTRLCGS